MDLTRLKSVHIILSSTGVNNLLLGKMTSFLKAYQKYSLTNKGAPLRKTALLFLNTTHCTQLDLNPQKYTFTTLIALSQTL